MKYTKNNINKTTANQDSKTNSTEEAVKTVSGKYNESNQRGFDLKF